MKVSLKFLNNNSKWLSFVILVYLELLDNGVLKAYHLMNCYFWTQHLLTDVCCSMVITPLLSYVYCWGT